MAAAAELLESTAAVDLLAATLPLPDEPLHASNGDRKCLGRFCCGTNTHGVWSEFGSFVPTEAGIAAGLSQLDSGDPVTWTSRADEGLGSGTSGRLLSFFVGKQVGTSSCHERYAAVVANTATGPKLDLVTLMGRGSECRVARGSELSSSDLHSVDTSTAQVAALRDEMRSKLRPLSVKAMKQKRHYVNTEAAKRKALRSSEAPTPRRRRCSSANDPPSTLPLQVIMRPSPQVFAWHLSHPPVSALQLVAHFTNSSLEFRSCRQKRCDWEPSSLCVQSKLDKAELR